MNGAVNTYNGINATAPTDFVAQMTPDQLGVFSKMLGTGNGLLSSVGTNVADAGSSAASSGLTGASGALASLLGADPSAINNIDATVKGGLAYASGMDIPGAVRAAMQPALETARDVTLPGITSGAAGTGNINSNRPDIASGIVQRGLAEQSQGLGAQLYNDAFTHGADTATGINTSNVAAKLGALSSALSGGTALGTGGTAASGGALSNLGDIFNLMTTGSAGPQQANQLDLENQLQKYQGATSLPYSALQGLMSIIGTNNWGSQSSGTQTTSSTPSAMQTIAGLMSGVGGLIGGPAGALGGGSGLLGMSPTLFGLLHK